MKDRPENMTATNAFPSIKEFVHENMDEENAFPSINDFVQEVPISKWADVSLFTYLLIIHKHNSILLI